MSFFEEKTLKNMTFHFFHKFAVFSFFFDRHKNPLDCAKRPPKRASVFQCQNIGQFFFQRKNLKKRRYAARLFKFWH